MVSSDGESALVLAHHQNLIEAAVGAGVSHVVALSSLDADLRSPFCYAVTNALTEQMLRDAGVGFSIARASIFTEFFLNGHTRRSTVARSVSLPPMAASHSSAAPTLPDRLPHLPSHRPRAAPTTSPVTNRWTCSPSPT